MIYNALKELIDKDKFLNDKHQQTNNQQQSATQQQQNEEIQRLLYKIIKINANIQGLIIEIHYKYKTQPKYLDQIIKEREAIYANKKTSKKKITITELQNEYNKIKNIQDKLLDKINEEYQNKYNGNLTADLSDDNSSISDDNHKNNNNFDDDSVNYHDLHNNNQSESELHIAYYAKHSSRTLENEMNRLIKSLNTVNSSNKISLKKLNQRVQHEQKEGKLIYFENNCDNLQQQLQPTPITILPNGKLQQQQQNQQNQQQTNKQKKKSKNNNEYQTDHQDTTTNNNNTNQNEDQMTMMIMNNRFGGFQKELGKDPRTKMSETELSELHLEYLSQLIFTLENKQVADSISKLTNCTKISKNHYQYQVQFEDALNAQPYYIDEKTLYKFNEYREHSLFKQYNLPVKTLFSATSHNYIQLNQFVTERNKLNKYKEINIVDAMKRENHNHNDIEHNKTLNQTRNFDICHHCRQIFDLGYLIKCNYRSSVMGMPQSNQSTHDQIFISQLVEYDSSSNSRRPFLNRKRNNYNSYIKKSNGELVCKRKFCLNCLKQNYDYKHEHHSKTDWVCPFCQGYCHCIRCIRNEMINKLKGVYLLYGGDIQYLEQESQLNKYLRPLSEEDRKKKEREDVYNRTTNSSMIANLVQKATYEKELILEKDLQSKLDDLTDVRFDMERVRLVISQVCRREKLKHLKLQEDLQSFGKKTTNLQNQLNKNNHHNNKITTLAIKSPTNKSIAATAAKKTNGIQEQKSKSKIAAKKTNDPKSKETKLKINAKLNKNKKKKEPIEEEDDDQSTHQAETDIEQEEDSEISDEDYVQSDASDEEEGQQQEEEEDAEENNDEDDESNQNSDQEVEEEDDDEEEEGVTATQDNNSNEEEESDAEEEVQSDADNSNEEEVEEEDEEDAENSNEEEQEEDDDEENNESDVSIIEEKQVDKKKQKNGLIKTRQQQQKNQSKNNNNVSTRNQSKNGKQVQQQQSKINKKKETQQNNHQSKKNNNKNIKQEKKSNVKSSKYIKRTKKSKMSGINKEIQNLIKNQDASIIQLTSSKEKSLRSNDAPSDIQHHESNKHYLNHYYYQTYNHQYNHKNNNNNSNDKNNNNKDGSNGINHKSNNNNKNHTKQNLSKYESNTKKKIKS